MLLKPISALIIYFLSSFFSPAGQGHIDDPFAMSAQSEPILTFGIFTDLQYCDCDPQGTRYYRNSLRKGEEAFSLFKDEGVSFVINLGDLIDRYPESFNPPLELIANSGLKVHHCPGNHDRFSNRADNKKIPGFLTENPYYSFTEKGIRFIILDATDISALSYSSRKKKEAEAMIETIKLSGGINGEVYNGALGKGQLDWFKSELNIAEKAGEKVLIFCHNPVWPESEYTLLNSTDILGIMADYDNIIAWFCGHHHSGNYGNKNLVHFVNLRGMVETEESNSFALVEVYHNKLWIKGFGRERNQILAY